MAHTHRKNHKSEYEKSLNQERKKIQKWTKKLVELSDDISEMIEKDSFVMTW